MIMKCIAYQNGVSIGNVTIEGISEALKREHTFVWPGLHETNSGLLARIRQESGLHELALKIPVRRINGRKLKNTATSFALRDPQNRKVLLPEIKGDFDQAD